MSVEEKWFACYYHYNNISLVRVFDLDTGAELLSSEVEPVYRKDMESRPFHAGDHGRKLYLCSSGVQHVLDLDSPAPTWSRKRAEKDLQSDTMQRNMISDCEQHMWRWIPHGQVYESLEDMTNILIKYLPGDILPSERICIATDIMDLSADLTAHSRIEEHILIPFVESLENAKP